MSFVLKKILFNNCVFLFVCVVSSGFVVFVCALCFLSCVCVFQIWPMGVSQKDGPKNGRLLEIVWVTLLNFT